MKTKQKPSLFLCYCRLGAAMTQFRLEIQSHSKSQTQTLLEFCLFLILSWKNCWNDLCLGELIYRMEIKPQSFSLEKREIYLAKFWIECFAPFTLISLPGGDKTPGTPTLSLETALFLGEVTDLH